MPTSASGNINAGRVQTSGRAVLSSSGAIQELGSDPEADLIAGTLSLTAASGIGAAAQEYRIQSSMDLVTWTTVATVTSDQASAAYTSPAPLAGRFFRVAPSGADQSQVRPSLRLLPDGRLQLLWSRNATFSASAAIEFSAAESDQLQKLLEGLLERLSGSDFTMMFPAHPVVCTVHHHVQLWWQTTDANIAVAIDTALPAIPG